MRKHTAPKKNAFSQVLDHLRDADRVFAPAELHHLSRLEGRDLAALEAAWPEIPVERRQSLLIDLTELSEANFEVDFEALFRLALEDTDAAVRAAAVTGLWEAEALDLVAPFIALLHTDPESPVRAAAATALGKYVYLGELEDIPAVMLHRVEDALLAAHRDGADIQVRRRALEALGYSSRPEIPALIEAAYRQSEDLLRVSALFAMGRSSDPERWGEWVLADLRHPVPEVRYEAVRAAGELQLPEAVAVFKQLLDEQDREVWEAILWSLSQIGGPEARRLITEQTALNEDEESEEFLAEVLDNLDFADDVEQFALLDVPDGFESDEDFLDEEDDEPDELPGSARRH